VHIIEYRYGQTNYKNTNSLLKRLLPVKPKTLHIVGKCNAIRVCTPSQQSIRLQVHGPYVNGEPKRSETVPANQRWPVA